MPKHPNMSVALPHLVPAEPTGASERECRSAPRYLFTATAEVREVHSGTSIIMRCSDLSAEGCYLDTISPFPLGAAVVVRITHGGRQFEAAAVVANSHFQMGMGLAFTEIGQEYRGVLRSWLGELSGEARGELPPAAPSPAPNFEPAAAAPAEAAGAEANLRMVTHELITLLVRKKLITEKDGTALLRQMFR